MKTTTYQANNRTIVRIDVQANQLGSFFSKINERIDRNYSMRDWIGGSISEVDEMVKYGDISQVAASKEFAKEVERKIPLPTRKELRVRSICGGSVSVPAALSGNPLAFRRNVVQEDPRNPVKIYVDIGISCGIEAETAQTRGRAIIAFASLLSQTRPVEVIAFTYLRLSGQNREALICINLGLTPINWAKAGAVLCNTALLRDFGFRAARFALDYDQGYEKWGTQYRGDVVSDDVLKAGADDIVVGRAYYGSKVATDPIGWVQDELARVAAGDLHGDQTAADNHREAVKAA